MVPEENLPKEGCIMKLKSMIAAGLSALLAICNVPIEPVLTYADAVTDAAILEEQLIMPIVSITSAGSITSKETYVDASVSIYDENGVAEHSDTPISIRLRGNSTLNAAKKSYRMKFGAKQNVLSIGDGAAKSWNLVANPYDTSMLRSMTAYHMADIMDGMPFNPNCQSVEVYLNGSYQGVYLLCEAVTVSKSRINIAELPDEVENNGYLLEMTRYAEENYFDTDLQRYEIKNDLSTDTTIAAQQKAYISGYIEDSYAAVENGTQALVEEYIDIDSLVDIYIISEIVKNVDAGWDSFYLFKDAGGKLTFGPMWDFDLALGNFIDVKGFDSWQGLNVYDVANISSNSNPWFCHIVQQQWFRELVVNRWNEKITELSTVPDWVKAEAQENLASYERNCQKWNTLGNKAFSEPDEIAELATYTAHAEYLADWNENRIGWMDTYFNSGDFVSGRLLDEDGKEITEDVNIAEYSTRFMMYASDYDMDDTPSFTVRFGANSWWNQFQQCMAGIMMEEGETYVISFDHTATKDMKLTYKIQQNYGSYRAYESGSTTASSDVQHFEAEFTADVQDTNCALIIEGNGSSGSEVTVSNICLRKVKKESVRGDVNGDGVFSVADAVMLQKWLLCAGELIDWQAGDLCEDERLDVFDLCIMKRMLLEEA